MATSGAHRCLEADLGDLLDGAIDGTRDAILAKQHPCGYWHAPLEANVGMDAQYVVFNRFMGRRPVETERRLVEHILAKQGDDGSWPLYHGGPGHLSTTIEAYFALKLTGHSPDEPALVRATSSTRTAASRARRCSRAPTSRTSASSRGRGCRRCRSS